MLSRVYALQRYTEIPRQESHKITENSAAAGTSDMDCHLSSPLFKLASAAPHCDCERVGNFRRFQTRLLCSSGHCVGHAHCRQAPALLTASVLLHYFSYIEFSVLPQAYASDHTGENQR